MRGGDFIFDLIQVMYYKCHKGNFRRGGFISRLDKKEKKTRINPENTNDKCFQYVATVALSYEEI